MRVSNMIKLAGVALGMAVLTGCATPNVVKVNNNGINLKIEVDEKIPSSIINAKKIEEASLARLKEKGIDQSDNGTPLTLTISNYRMTKSGGSIALTGGSTGFAAVDALNAIVTSAKNIDTVASNLSGNASIETRVDYKLMSGDKYVFDFNFGVAGTSEVQEREYIRIFSNLVQSVVEK